MDLPYSDLVGRILTTPFSTSIDEQLRQTLETEHTPHPAIERVRQLAQRYWKM